MALKDFIAWLTRKAFNERPFQGKRTVDYAQKERNRQLRREKRSLWSRLRKMGRARNGAWA